MRGALLACLSLAIVRCSGLGDATCPGWVPDLHLLQHNVDLERTALLDDATEHVAHKTQLSEETAEGGRKSAANLEAAVHASPGKPLQALPDHTAIGHYYYEATDARGSLTITTQRTAKLWLSFLERSEHNFRSFASARLGVEAESHTVTGLGICSIFFLWTCLVLAIVCVARTWSTKTMAIKPYLSWGTGIAFFLCDLYIHLKCGFGEEVLEQEEECLGIKGWGSIPVFTEAFCHSGFAVMLAGMILEMVAAAKNGELGAYLHSAFIGEDQKLSFAALALACFTTSIGFYNLHKDGAIPYWMIFYLHVFEGLCALLVLSCVVGLICDFCTSCAAGKAGSFLRGFAICTDSLDDHGIGGEDEEATAGASEQEPPNIPRAVLLWFVFVIVMVAAYHEETSKHDDKFDSLITSTRAVFGVFCSGGISMALVFGLANMESAMESAVAGKSMGSMLPQYKGSADSGEK